MNWRPLELLRWVVESSSFAQAARHAGVSQPAVSQAMRVLAAQVGEPLFLRKGRRAIPTERALRLARAMQSVDAILKGVERRETEPTATTAPRPLRVGLAPAAGLLYGATMAQTLGKCTPRPTLTIVTESTPHMLEALARGELDAVIGPRPRGHDHSGLRQHVMYVSRPLIYCRKGHPLATATTLRQIMHAQWAVAGLAGTPSNVIEEAFRVRHWKPPKIAVQCADYAMLVQIVGDTDLLAVISHPRLAPLPQRTNITPLHVEDGLPHYEVCLFWREEGTPLQPAGLTPLIAALMAHSPLPT